MQSGAAVMMEEVRTSIGTADSAEELDVMSVLDAGRAREVEALVEEMEQEAERYARLARRVGAVVHAVKARHQSAWRCGLRFSR